MTRCRETDRADLGPEAEADLAFWRDACRILQTQGWDENLAHIWLWHEGDWIPRVTAVLDAERLGIRFVPA
jgi:hypothetical protein